MCNWGLTPFVSFIVLAGKTFKENYGNEWPELSVKEIMTNIAFEQ
jgi:hypothetical protein